MSLAYRALLLASLPCACTIGPPPQHVLPEATSPQDPASGPGQWGERVLFEATAAPVALLTRDFDGLPDNSRSEDATGWGVRAGIGDLERSAGVLFQSFRSDGDLLDADVVSLDFDVRTSLESEVPMLFMRAGASVGVAFLDTVGIESDSELATQLRLGIDFQPSPRFLLDMSIGGIVFGTPGETEGYGSFLSVGGALVF